MGNSIISTTYRNIQITNELTVPESALHVVEECPIHSVVLSNCSVGWSEWFVTLSSRLHSLDRLVSEFWRGFCLSVSFYTF